MISVIFPHADNPENNRVLELNRHMLAENSRYPVQLLYVSGTLPKDVYPTWNYLASIARYDLILWSNTDVLMGPEWDVAIQKHANDADWLGINLVECGAIEVAESNVCRDFGRTAETFDRPAFKAFCVKESRLHPSIEHGRFAWYSPSVFRKQWFFAMGGFSTEKPFPHPNDVEFRSRATGMGCRFAVVNSFAYHLQRARENMGEKSERC